MQPTIQPEKITQPIALTAPEWEALQVAAGALQRGGATAGALTPSAALTALLTHLVGPAQAPADGSTAGQLDIAPGSAVTAYTDGACSGNPGPGGWAAVLVVEGGESGPPTMHELSGGDVNTTNNRMELTAAIEALQAIPAGTLAEVVTDSTYVKSGATQWMAGWKRNGWKNSDRKPVKNQDLWRRLDELMETRKVTWRWVKGHAGDEHNERADVLAREAIPFTAKTEEPR